MANPSGPRNRMFSDFAHLKRAEVGQARLRMKHLLFLRSLLKTSCRSRSEPGVALWGSMAQSSFLRIGTRGSPLALWQAREVRAHLAAAHGVEPEAIAIEAIRTTGDVIQDRPAVGSRRQRLVHQGDRASAPRQGDRSRGAFQQGHANGAAGRAGNSRRACPAEDVTGRLHQPQGHLACGSPAWGRGRHRIAAPPGHGSSVCGPTSRW